jgi:hypothetical protein
MLRLAGRPGHGIRSSRPALWIITIRSAKWDYLGLRGGNLGGQAWG